MNWKRAEVVFEFFIFGVVIGVTEDIIAIKLTTGENITLEMLVIIILIAIPFAFLGEILIDRVDFAEIFRKLFNNKK